MPPADTNDTGAGMGTHGGRERTDEDLRRSTGEACEAFLKLRGAIGGDGVDPPGVQAPAARGDQPDQATQSAFDAPRQAGARHGPLAEAEHRLDPPALPSPIPWPPPPPPPAPAPGGGPPARSRPPDRGGPRSRRPPLGPHRGWPTGGWTRSPRRW